MSGLSITANPQDMTTNELSALSTLFKTLADARLPFPKVERDERQTEIEDYIATHRDESVLVMTSPPAVPDNPASVFAPPTATAVPERDADGLPWDERIHASSKALTVDGVWRKKRGVDDATVTAVTTELRAGQATPIPAPPPVAPVPVPPPPVEQPTPVPPPPPVTVADDQPKTFATLMAALTPKMTDGSITSARIAEACAAVGIPSLPVLASRADLVSVIWTELGL